MRYDKRLLLALSAVGVIGAAGISATAIAATDSNSGEYPPIVKRLASTFNLDPAKVNDVFKQQREQNHQNRENKLKSSLDQAVKDGKLTQEQADKLLAKLKSLKAEHKNGDKSNRREVKEDMRAELQQWAKDNGIENLDEILASHKHHGHHDKMMGDKSGNQDNGRF